MERKERFSIPLLLSLLIHAVLILLIALTFAKRAAEKPEPPPEPPMPEVTLEIPPPDKERPFMEAKEIADKAPEKAPFESDENTKAASELPVTGSAPLPSQQGLVQKALELQNQHYTPGEQPATTAGNPAPSHPPSPPTPPTPAKKEEAKTEPTPTPTATPESSATPQPTPPIPPPPNSVKLLELPKEQPTPRPSIAQRTASTPSQPAMPPSQPGAQGAKRGYQPETQQTVVYGSISNRGRSSVAAEATPLGKYKKKVSTAIGSRWYYYTQDRSPDIGSVTVSFRINALGKAIDLRVISSTSNSALTDCTLRSIMDAKIPPIPPEVAATLQEGSLEYASFTFTIY